MFINYRDNEPWTNAFETNKEDLQKIDEITCIKTRWKQATEALKDAQYLEQLIYADYVRTIKSFKTIWDYRISSIEKAISEVGKTKKKERENLSFIETSIKEDFFNDIADINIKINKIVTCDYAAYAYQLYFDVRGTEFSIQIPVRARLNTENLKYASEGRFEFIQTTSAVSTKVICSDWSVEGLAKKIKEHLNPVCCV